MRIAIAVLLLTSSLWGQATLTLSGPAAARNCATITINVNLSAPGPDLAALQWSVGLPLGITPTAVAGPASVAAGKLIYCGTNSTCLLVGVNTNVYPAAGGVVASYQLVIPGQVPPGPLAIPLSGLVAASLAGDNVPLVSGPTYTVNVLARTDLNGDGKTDVQDLQILIQEILNPPGGAGPSPNDQNGDGVLNVRDAQIVACAIK